MDEPILTCNLEDIDSSKMSQILATRHGAPGAWVQLYCFDMSYPLPEQRRFVSLDISGPDRHGIVADALVAGYKDRNRYFPTEYIRYASLSAATRSVDNVVTYTAEYFHSNGRIYFGELVHGSDYFGETTADDAAYVMPSRWYALSRTHRLYELTPQDTLIRTAVIAMPAPSDEGCIVFKNGYPYLQGVPTAIRPEKPWGKKSERFAPAA